MENKYYKYVVDDKVIAICINADYPSMVEYLYVDNNYTKYCWNKGSVYGSYFNHSGKKIGTIVKKNDGTKVKFKIEDCSKKELIVYMIKDE